LARYVIDSDPLRSPWSEPCQTAVKLECMGQQSLLVLADEHEVRGSELAALPGE